MLSNLLSDIVCQEFMSRVGKNQARQAEPKAMLISFTLSPKSDEEGYRYLDLLIYGPMNYVGVFVRERWNVIPVADLVGEDGDERPAPGKGYQKGSSEWVKVCYHDSGWRDGVRQVLYEHGDRLNTFSGISSWYETITPPAEILGAS